VAHAPMRGAAKGKRQHNPRYRVGCRFPGPDRESRIGRVRHNLSGLGVPPSSRPASWPAVTCHAPAPPLPPPAGRRTGERGAVMALPGRTPRSHGQNRVSGEISCPFPGLARQAGIARRYRPGTMLTVALRSQPAAGAGAGLAGTHASLYRRMGATAPIYRGERDLDHQTARKAGRRVGRSRQDGSSRYVAATVGCAGRC
jgi:hypothetical protein